MKHILRGTLPIKVPDSGARPGCGLMGVASVIKETTCSSKKHVVWSLAKKIKKKKSPTTYFLFLLLYRIKKQNNFKNPYLIIKN